MQFFFIFFMCYLPIFEFDIQIDGKLSYCPTDSSLQIINTEEMCLHNKTNQMVIDNAGNYLLFNKRVNVLEGEAYVCSVKEIKVQTYQNWLFFKQPFNQEISDLIIKRDECLFMHKTSSFRNIRLKCNDEVCSSYPVITPKYSYRNIINETYFEIKN